MPKESLPEHGTQSGGTPLRDVGSSLRQIANCLGYMISETTRKQSKGEEDAGKEKAQQAVLLYNQWC